jgi:hypothetical protein
MPEMTPEARVSKAANSLIFLGLLYVFLSLGALVRHYHAAYAWQDVLTLGIALSSIGLGYGVRYGSCRCLYAATGLFTVLTGYLFWAGVSWQTLRLAIRCLLSGYTVSRLYRAISPMRQLRAQQAFPLPLSRYGAFFLRRKALAAAEQVTEKSAGHS